MKCERCYHEEQPRQGNLSDSKGYIELISGHNYEQGLKDLDGFSRIWLIYEFHQNKTWRPLDQSHFDLWQPGRHVFH